MKLPPLTCHAITQSCLEQRLPIRIFSGVALLFALTHFLPQAVGQNLPAEVSKTSRQVQEGDRQKRITAPQQKRPVSDVDRRSANRRLESDAPDSQAMLQQRRKQAGNSSMTARRRRGKKGSAGTSDRKNRRSGSSEAGNSTMDRRAQQILRLLAKADVNQDKKISVEEAPPMLKDRFARIDRNSDGFVDVDEVNALLQLLRQRMKAGMADSKDSAQAKFRMQVKQRMDRSVGQSGPPVKPIRPGRLK